MPRAGLAARQWYRSRAQGTKPPLRDMLTKQFLMEPFVADCRSQAAAPVTNEVCD